MTDGEVTHIRDATRAAEIMFTPHKKRRLVLVLASPTESEVSFQDITFVPLVTDPGPNVEVSVASVLGQWVGCLRVRSVEDGGKHSRAPPFDGLMGQERKQGVGRSVGSVVSR
jgi:hypothetical protein